MYPPHDFGLIESMLDWALGYNTPSLAGHWQQIRDMQEACRIYLLDKATACLSAAARHWAVQQ